MPSSGGSISIQWTASSPAVVNITGGAASAFTVNGNPVTFPYTLATTTKFDTVFDGSYSVSVLLNGYEIASTPDGVRVVQLNFGNGLSFSPTVDDQPDNNFATSLSATYARKVQGDAVPEVKGAAEAKVLYNPGGVNNAAWQVSMLGLGRIFHLTLEDATADGALIACGLDFGNANYPQGILLANKAQSRGMTVDQQSTVTDTAAYGLYVRQASANAPASQFEVQTAGAAPAMQLSALNASASQKLIAYRSNTGAGTTEECGIVRADNGWLLWNKVIRPGQYTSSGRTAISGLGSSTRGAAVYNTDKQQPEVFTDLGWRSVQLRSPLLTKATSYNMTIGDSVIVSNGSSITMSLPDPTTVLNDAHVFVVKNIHSTSCTVNSQGSSKTIDGAASAALAQWAAGRYVSDGTQWLTV